MVHRKRRGVAQRKWLFQYSTRPQEWLEEAKHVIEKCEAGLKVRREVLGNAYVEQSTHYVSEFMAPPQKLVIEYCWGRSGRDRVFHGANAALSTGVCSPRLTDRTSCDYTSVVLLTIVCRIAKLVGCFCSRTFTWLSGCVGPSPPGQPTPGPKCGNTLALGSRAR